MPKYLKFYAIWQKKNERLDTQWERQILGVIKWTGMRFTPVESCKMHFQGCLAQPLVISYSTVPSFKLKQQLLERGKQITHMFHKLPHKPTISIEKFIY